MSKKWRIIGIAAVFLLAGGLLWFLLSGSEVDDDLGGTVRELEFGGRYGDVPEFEFDAVALRGTSTDSSAEDLVDAEVGADTLIDQAVSDEDDDETATSIYDKLVLMGVVRNTEGKALPGAFIFVGTSPMRATEWEGLARARTDFEGRFDLEIRFRKAKITASAIGYLNESVLVRRSSLEVELELVLNKGGTVEGYVYADGVAQGLVKVGGSFGRSGERRLVQSETDSRGFYHLEGLLGNVSLSALIHHGNDDRRLRSTVVVEEGMTTVHDFNFVSSSSFVEGYVMAGENQPSAGSAGLRNVEVKSDGYYLFENVPAGAISLFAHIKNSGTSKRVFAELSEDETLRLDVNLFGGVNVLYSVTGLAEGYTTQLYALPADYVVPPVLTRDDVVRLSQSSFQDVRNFDNGMSGFSLIEPGDYKIVAFGYNGEGADYKNEGGYWTSAPVHVEGDEDVYVTLSFPE